MDDDDDEVYPHAGQRKNPKAILVLSDGSDNEIEYKWPSKSNPADDTDDSEDKEVSEEEKLQEETDQQELGNLFWICSMMYSSEFILQDDCKKTGNHLFMLFTAQKLLSHTPMDVAPMISSVLPKTVRERVEMQDLFDITSIQKTISLPVVSINMQKYVGVKKLLNKLPKHRISSRHEKH